MLLGEDFKRKGLFNQNPLSKHIFIVGPHKAPLWLLCLYIYGCLYFLTPFIFLSSSQSQSLSCVWCLSLDLYFSVKHTESFCVLIYFKWCKCAVDLILFFIFSCSAIFKKKLIYLAASGLSCDPWGLWSSCGMWALVSWPEIESGPPALGSVVLATGPPGKSQSCLFKIPSHCCSYIQLVTPHRCVIVCACTMVYRSLP